MLADCGALTDIIASGARILECACGPCIGMGFSPNSGGVSLRTFNRVFQERFRQTPSQYRKSRTGALWGAQDGQRRKGA